MCRPSIFWVIGVPLMRSDRLTKSVVFRLLVWDKAYLGGKETERMGCLKRELWLPR